MVGSAETNGAKEAKGGRAVIIIIILIIVLFIVLIIVLLIVLIIVLFTVQGVFLTGTPPKSSKYEKVNLG